MINRRNTKKIQIGDVTIGGGAPISVQSMCNTDTRDVKSTLNQIQQLSDSGCEIIRLAVLNKDAGDSIKEIIKKSPIPVVADIHFDYRLAIQCINNGINALRLNPGNIGKRENVEQVVKLAKQQQIPIRIGVNAGSLEKELLEENIPLSEKMVKSALKHIQILEDLDFDLIKVSLKSSDVLTTIEAYRSISEKIPYPLHLGVTEAGTLISGITKSAVGLGTLLSEGIGDTIRVSLTENPVEEINAGYLYSYSITEKKLNIIEKLNKSSIIGYHTKYIVYWVNKNFYYKETGQEDSTFIIEDEAFDSGFTHYSYVRFKKYKESFEIFMHVDKGVLFPECYEKVVTIDWNTLNIKII